MLYFSQRVQRILPEVIILVSRCSRTVQLLLIVIGIMHEEMQRPGPEGGLE
jgi:hypothetical protein